MLLQPQEIIAVFASLKPAILTLCLGALAIGVSCSRAPDDRQIAIEVRSQTQQNSAIHGEVQAESAHGTVTLNGHVESEAERVLASRDAAAVVGVKQVVNNLTVVPRAASPTSAAPQLPAPPSAAPMPAPPTSERGQRRTARQREAQANSPDGRKMATNTPLPALPPLPAGFAPPTEPAPPAALPPPSTPSPAPVKHVIPAGTILSVRLINGLDSSRNRVGDTFRATLNAPIRDGGEVVISAGVDVEGRVVDVSNAGPYSGHSELRLELTKVIWQGEVYALQTESYDRADSGRGTGTAQAVGGTAAVGAIVGAIAGGGKGAAIGSVAGAGAGGLARGVSKPQPITFPPETVLTFKLLQPVTVASGETTSNPRTRLQNSESYPQAPPPVRLPPPPPPMGAPPVPAPWP
jgi:hypothetical protein